MQHHKKALSADLSDAIAAYRGSITVCDPGPARAPATSPDFDRETGRATRNQLRSLFGADYLTFADINDALRKQRAKLSADLAALRISTR